MADRYWVAGGSGNWNGTDTNNWSATSGGASGASVPTTADDVFFDANSGAGTATIATGNTGAKSITCTGFTGTITGSAAITVAGSVTLVSGMTYTHTGTMTFTGTGTLTTAGKTFSVVNVNGSGITLTLGDALNVGTASGKSIQITQGIFNTANYNVTCNLISSNNANVRTITLGSSTVTCGGNGVTFTSSTNLTFNAGTSTINVGGGTATFNGGSQTFYNVSFTSPLAGTRDITGANTFNNLTLNASATGLSQLSISADQTVNGTFTCAGSSAIQRGFVRSNTIGTTRTITAATLSADDCDFRDITIAGGAAGTAPTRAGDCGGNSGITFPAAKTVYRVGTSTSWGNPATNSWALTSGGTGSQVNFPLAQDTAIIDNNTALTGTLAFTQNWNICALDCSSRTTGITLNYNNSSNWYGSHTLGSGVTIAGTTEQTFAGRGTMPFTSAGKTITFSITVDAPGGTFQLGDAFSSSNTITHTQGTFDANNYNLTCRAFASSNSNTRTITMGSGLWTLMGTGTIWSSSSTGLTLNKDTANILLSDNSTQDRRFDGGGLSYNKLIIGGNTSTSTLNLNVTAISTGTSFAEIASTKTVAHTIVLSQNLGTIGTWSVTGSLGNIVTLQSSVAGIRRNFTLTNVTSGIDYLSVKDIGELSGNKFYVGANSTDGGNNSNVYFTAAPAPAATGNMFFMFY